VGSKKVLDQTDNREEECERYCDECGDCMSQGYVVADGEEYYCSEKCLHKHYTPEQWKKMYVDGVGYYTEWEESCL